MKKESWLLVANGSRAHLYKIEKKKSLIEVAILEHPEARLHNRDLVSDKPGTDFESVGHARHRVEPHHTPKQNEFHIFAKTLSQYLEDARVKGDFEKLYIAAGPMILGLLRQNFTPATTHLICGEVDKDMTQMKTDEIVSHLPFLL